MSPDAAAPRTLRLLVADDERPALDELVSLLESDPRIAAIVTASSGTEALRVLSTEPIDAALLDIHMPGLTGLELAQALQRFERRPPVVFVTADEERAVDAFDLDAVDYVLKPVRTERLARAVGRLVDAVEGAPIITSGSAAAAGGVAATSAATSTESPDAPATIAVTLGATTRLVRRDAIRYAQAQGDYARLHTADGGFLVRVPISDLEQQWAGAGFVRVHRSYLVALEHITQLRLSGASPSITVGDDELPVSRRLLPALRERIAEHRVRPRA
ncbi:MAG: LytR/AlgR family response regulator transcription factor [Microcella sp.]